MLKKSYNTLQKLGRFIIFLFVFHQLIIPQQSIGATSYTYNNQRRANVGMLKGEVKFADGTPGIYVTVYIKSLKKHSITDEKGRFAIKGIPYGEHLVETRTMEAKNRKIKIIIDKKITDLTIELKENAINLNEVVVQGKNEGQRSKAKGFSVDVLETSKIMLQSIQTSDYLDRTAGIKIRQDGGLGSRINYNINGLSGRSVKIFINGLPADNYGRSFSLNSIPSSSIERIEVYKGVVPAYLSQDALGGAINVVLKQKRTKSLNASSSFGSFNTSQSNINGSYRSESGFTANGTVFYNYSDNNYRVYGPQIKKRDARGGVYDLPNGAKRFNDAYEAYGGQINLGYTNVKWADLFLIGTVLSKTRKEIQHGSTMENVYGDRHSKYASKVLTLNYSKRNLFIERLNLKIDASYSNISRQVVDTVGNKYDWTGNPIRDKEGKILKHVIGYEVDEDGEPILNANGERIEIIGSELSNGIEKSLEINSDRSYSIRTNLSYNINDNNSVFANYFHNSFKRKINDELKPLGHQRLVNTRDLEKSIFAFTYENTAFSDRLKSSLFYKRYMQRATSNEPYRDNKIPLVGDLYKLRVVPKDMHHNGYGFASSYILTPEIILSSSAEKAIRMPSEYELFGSNSENVTAPLDDLKPEISTNVNLGANIGPYKLNDHSMSLNSSIFYRGTKGMIREIVDSKGIFSQHENLENVLSYGIDAEFIYKFKEKLAFNFNISKAYVLFNTEYNKSGARYEFYGTQIRNEPSFKFNTNLSYTLQNLFLKGAITTFSYNLYFVKGFNRDWANVGGRNLNLIPTQYPNDLSVAYVFPNKKATFSIDAKNIFNQQLFDNFGLQKPGRAFFAKITYSFL